MPLVRSRTVTCDPDRALHTARATLAAMEFTVRTEGHTLHATSPGWSSTSKPALLGASELTLTAHPDRLELSAELGHLRRMQGFAVLFGPALMLLLEAGFVASGMAGDPQLVLLGALFFGLAGAGMAWTLPSRVKLAIEGFLDAVEDGGHVPHELTPPPGT